MSKFDANIDNLNDLIEMFDNMQNQASSIEGTLTINVLNIKNNLERFNREFETNFSLDTTEDEYQEYFSNEYTSFIQEHLTDNVDCKEHFNSVYLEYAHID